eukprot:TRINITY_DN2652_c0_g1_i1.p1 TRINITY_DN2652_c0_g1~~TRINITY_DN2652_c0_g1_i1.p1  ORF type:complete len:180 (+),score=33.60 TRINITY_DN2652_c0_g1_i1:53-541(+)
MTLEGVINSAKDILNQKDEFWYIELDEKWKKFVSEDSINVITNIYQYNKFVEKNSYSLNKMLKNMKKEATKSIFSPLSDVGAHITIAKPPPKAKAKKIFFEIQNIRQFVNHKMGNPSEFDKNYYIDTWFVVDLRFDIERSEHIPTTDYNPHISICCQGYVLN